MFPNASSNTMNSISRILSIQYSVFYRPDTFYRYRRSQTHTHTHHKLFYYYPACTGNALCFEIDLLFTPYFEFACHTYYIFSMGCAPQQQIRRPPRALAFHVNTMEIVNCSPAFYSFGRKTDFLDSMRWAFVW